MGPNDSRCHRRSPTTLQKTLYLNDLGGGERATVVDGCACQCPKRAPSMLAPTKAVRPATSGVDYGGLSVHAAVSVPAQDKKRRI